MYKKSILVLAVLGLLVLVVLFVGKLLFSTKTSTYFSGGCNGVEIKLYRYQAKNYIEGDSKPDLLLSASVNGKSAQLFTSNANYSSAEQVRAAPFSAVQMLDNSSAPMRVLYVDPGNFTKEDFTSIAQCLTEKNSELNAAYREKSEDFFYSAPPYKAVVYTSYYNISNYESGLNKIKPQ